MLFKKFYKGSDWITEKIHSQYINILIFRPLSGSSYIKLPTELKKNKLKNLWCHTRNLNPLKIHPERITKQDKEIINTFDYERVDFFLCLKIF